jgi:hypothetical protein
MVLNCPRLCLLSLDDALQHCARFNGLQIVFVVELADDFADNCVSTAVVVFFFLRARIFHVEDDI